MTEVIKFKIWCPQCGGQQEIAVGSEVLRYKVNKEVRLSCKCGLRADCSTGMVDGELRVSWQSFWAQRK